MSRKNELLELLDSEFHSRVNRAINLLRSIENSDIAIERAVSIAIIIASEMNLQSEAICTAILFRAVTDNGTLFSDLGEFDTPLMEAVVKVNSLKKRDILYQTDSFIQMVLAHTPDPRAVLILLAENLEIIRSPNETLSELFLTKIHLIYAPIAHRLGLYAIKTELEEQWMKASKYKIYKDIANKLAAKKEEREEFIRKFIAPIKKDLIKENIDCEIKGRPKSIYSIWKKMIAQNVDVDGVYDKFAIRIIIETDDLAKEKELCWKVYSITTQSYRPYPKRLRDWISNPKSSGYESLHTTIETEDGHWVEVQIRTRRMDDVAENGYAAHWKYKEGNNGSSAGWLEDMRKALERDIKDDLVKNEIKESLYNRDIFVFTPKEEIKKLRNNSTVLDFAFSIHEKIGLTCTGAKINGYHSPIKSILKNGDTVEITTSKNQKPSKEWLNIVKSNGAKQKIRRALRAIEFSNLSEGKLFLRKKLESLNFRFVQSNIDKLVHHFKLDDQNSLFDLIGKQEINILSNKIKEILKDEPKKSREFELSPIKPTVKNETLDALIIDDGNILTDISFASCCKPVKGDDIFGFVTVNKGIRVHKKSCSNAKDLITHHSHRIVETVWSSSSSENRFSTVFTIIINNMNSGLPKITATTKMAPNTSLLNLKLTPKKELFEVHLEVSLKSRESANSLRNSLLEISEVVDVF